MAQSGAYETDGMGEVKPEEVLLEQVRMRASWHFDDENGHEYGNNKLKGRGRYETGIRHHIREEGGQKKAKDRSGEKCVEQSARQVCTSLEARSADDWSRIVRHRVRTLWADESRRRTRTRPAQDMLLKAERAHAPVRAVRATESTIRAALDNLLAPGRFEVERAGRTMIGSIVGGDGSGGSGRVQRHRASRMKAMLRRYARGMSTCLPEGPWHSRPS